MSAKQNPYHQYTTTGNQYHPNRDVSGGATNEDGTNHNDENTTSITKSTTETTNAENRKNNHHESLSIALYEYWHRNYRQATIMSRTYPNHHHHQGSDDSKPHHVLLQQQQQFLMQYQALLHEFQETNMIDPINLRVLQQIPLFPNDSIMTMPPIASGSSQPFTTTTTTSTIAHTDRSMERQQQQQVPPHVPLDNPDWNHIVDDFFQKYPHSSRDHHRSRHAETATTVHHTLPQQRHQNDHHHHPNKVNHGKNGNDNYSTMERSNNVEENDLCVIVEPEQPHLDRIGGLPQSQYPRVQPPPPPQQQRRTKRQHRLDLTIRKDDDDDDDDYIEIQSKHVRTYDNKDETNHAYNSRRSKQNHQGSRNATNKNVHDDANMNNSMKRPTNKNPFQTAREVAQSHVFDSDDDDDEERHGNGDKNIRQPLNAVRNNENDNCVVAVERPVSSNTQRQPHKTTTTNVNNNNPYQTIVPPPPVIRESLKRKFQPPIKRSTTMTEVTEEETTTQPARNRRSKKLSSESQAASTTQSTNRSSVSTILGPKKSCTTTNHQGHHTNTAAVDDDDDDELPEELRIYGKELVEKIENEIMDAAHSTRITFDDIAGLHDQKQTVYEVVCWPMQRPDLFTGLRRAPNGLLLYGPPGTGKTLIGKAIAHESGATFFSISSSSLTSKWIGEGEKLVRVLFAVAAYRQPAVIFIDEIDSLLTQRKSDENEASRRIKTEFLIQLDGTGTSGQGRVLVIGATNRPQELDEAARRRFTKRLYIPLPEIDDREALIRVLLKTNHHLLSDSEIRALAKETEGFSGADLKALSTDAAMGPIRQLGAKALEVNLSDVPPISYRHFRQSLKGLKPSVSPDDLVQYVEWDKVFGTKRAQTNDDSDTDSDDDANSKAPCDGTS